MIFLQEYWFVSEKVIWNSSYDVLFVYAEPVEKKTSGRGRKLKRLKNERGKGKGKGRQAKSKGSKGRRKS